MSRLIFAVLSVIHLYQVPARASLNPGDSFQVALSQGPHNSGRLFMPLFGNELKLRLPNSLSVFGKSLDLTDTGKYNLLEILEIEAGDRDRIPFLVPLTDISTEEDEQEGWYQRGVFLGKIYAREGERGKYLVDLQVQKEEVSISYPRYMDRKPLFTPTAYSLKVNVNDIVMGNKDMHTAIRILAMTPILATEVAHDIGGHAYLIPESVINFQGARSIPIVKSRQSTLAYTKNSLMLSSSALPVSQANVEGITRFFEDNQLTVASFSVSTGATRESIIAEAKDILKRLARETRHATCSGILLNLGIPRLEIE